MMTGWVIFSAEGVGVSDFPCGGVFDPTAEVPETKAGLPDEVAEVPEITAEVPETKAEVPEITAEAP